MAVLGEQGLQIGNIGLVQGLARQLEQQVAFILRDDSPSHFIAVKRLSGFHFLAHQCQCARFHRIVVDSEHSLDLLGLARTPNPAQSLPQRVKGVLNFNEHHV